MKNGWTGEWGWGESRPRDPVSFPSFLTPSPEKYVDYEKREKRTGRLVETTPSKDLSREGTSYTVRKTLGAVHQRRGFRLGKPQKRGRSQGRAYRRSPTQENSVKFGSLGVTVRDRVFMSRGNGTLLPSLVVRIDDCGRGVDR